MAPKEAEKKKPLSSLATKTASPTTSPSKPAQVPAKVKTSPATTSGTTPSATTKTPTKTPAKTLSSPSAKKPAAAKKPDAAAKKVLGVKGAGDKKAAAGAVAAAAPAEPEVDEEEKARLKIEALTQATAEMEELHKKAWLAQVEFERKEEAKRRKKAEEESKRRKEEAALTKALLEAAFDGDDQELLQLLSKSQTGKSMDDYCDAHGNTLLSEAAAGGSASTVQLLLDRSANPNSQGEFLRTPLWRASFLGKVDLIMPLLEGGADPRIGNEGGETPLHVASVPSIKQTLQEWDVACTDALVAKWKEQQDNRIAAAAAQRAEAIQGAEGEVEAAKQSFDQAQQVLRNKRMELEKRIFEHDMCVEENKAEELIKVTLEQVHAAESAVESARAASVAASQRLDSARLALREQQAVQGGSAGAEAEEGMVGLPVDIKALDDVLIRDVGDKIKADGRWPLVIDPSGQASVFLRYLDTNYINALSCQHMEPNRLRRSILGGIRYGKPVVLDLMDCDLWAEVQRRFDAIQPGLLAALMDKTLLQSDGFQCLIRAEDGEEYDMNKFQAVRVQACKLVLLTASLQPAEDLVRRTYALRVVVKG